MADEYKNGQIAKTPDGKQFVYDDKQGWMPIGANYSVSPKKAETDLGGPAARTAKDMGRAAIETGPVKMVSSMLGAPADAVELGVQGADFAKRKAAEWAGYDPMTPRESQVPSLGPLQGSAGVQQSIEDNVLKGPLYKPETSLGNVAAKASEYGTNPLTYVGGGEAAALRPLTRAVAPAVAQQAAPDDPWSQIAAGMVAPKVGGRIISPFRGSPEHFGQAEMVANALKPSGAKVSAGQQTGSPILNAIEEKAGMSGKLSPQVQNRGHLQAQLEMGGVKGDNLVNTKATRTLIPNELDKVRTELDTLEKSIPLSAIMTQDKKLNWMQQNTYPEHVAKWQDARRRYAQLMDLEKAGNINSPTAAGGVPTPSEIASVMRPNVPGRDLANAANAVLSRQDKANLNNVGHIAGAIAGGVAGHGSGNLYGLGGATAGGIAGPWAVDATLKALGKGLNSPITQWWFKNQKLMGSGQRIPAGVNVGSPPFLNAGIVSGSARNPPED